MYEVTMEIANRIQEIMDEYPIGDDSEVTGILQMTIQELYKIADKDM